MSEERATDWGFVKLLLGLDTAVAGALIYGQEHILHVQESRWLLASSVSLLVISLLLSLWAASILVHADYIREQRAIFQQHNPAYELKPPHKEYVIRQVALFRTFMSCAMGLFGAGVLAAFGFFLWNLPSITNAGAVSGSAYLAHALFAPEPPKMTSVPCNPFFDGWQIRIWWPRYVLYCALVALAFRAFHSLLRARAVNTGDFPQNRQQTEFQGLGRAFWYNFKGVTEFKEHSDLWIPFGIGVIELAVFPILLALGQIVIIGGWIGIKTAGGWMGWQASRTSFNRFVLFNLLNLLVSYFWLARYVQRLPC